MDPISIIRSLNEVAMLLLPLVLVATMIIVSFSAIYMLLKFARVGLYAPKVAQRRSIKVGTLGFGGRDLRRKSKHIFGKRAPHVLEVKEQPSVEVSQIAEQPRSLQSKAQPSTTTESSQGPSEAMETKKLDVEAGQPLKTDELQGQSQQLQKEYSTPTTHNEPEKVEELRGSQEHAQTEVDEIGESKKQVSERNDKWSPVNAKNLPISKISLKDVEGKDVEIEVTHESERSKHRENKLEEPKRIGEKNLESLEAGRSKIAGPSIPPSVEEPTSQPKQPEPRVSTALKEDLIDIIEIKEEKHKEQTLEEVNVPQTTHEDVNELVSLLGPSVPEATAGSNNLAFIFKDLASNLKRLKEKLESFDIKAKEAKGSES
ncbi:MAG: hypothetical protein QW701_03005 [Candidatus Nezhaarchaeales archaeon]